MVDDRSGESRARFMTVGQLSRRTGVPIKALREYEGMGLLYTVGRSPGADFRAADPRSRTVA